MSSALDLRRRWAALALMVASGFAGLGYQIVWTQQAASWLGHESASVLAVVAAFFGGLAVGALALGGRIEASARPVRWYAGCELVVAAWSGLLRFVWAPVGGGVMAAIGPQPSALWHWSVAFGATFLLLLPATAAMGATLPAMERLTVPLREGEPRSVAALYAANTFGAVLGVVTSAFYLVPVFGLARSAAVCVALNLVCGVLPLALFSGTVVKTAQRPAVRAPIAEQRREQARGVLWRLALTGFLGIAYEVLVVRVLSQVAEDTVYTFALVLAVYLLGSAAGAAAYQRWLDDRREPEPSPAGDPDRVRDRLLAALAVACLAGSATLWGADAVRAWVMRSLGAGMAAALGSEAVPALLAFGPPTIVMGALFSHLGRSASAAGVSFGRALGVNALAAATAPAICGVLAIRALGAKLALVAIVVGYLAAAGRRAWSTPLAWVPAAVALGVALVAPPLAFVDVPEGGHVVSYQEGILAAVSVVEDAGGVARLRINNRQQEGSSATWRADARQAWLPLLLHPAPRRALFLGLGTGVTAASAADDPTLEVEAVELLPEVIAAATHFADRSSTAGAGGSRLHVVTADARRFVRATERRYDVIVSDNFHPARSGSAALYTIEHFEAVRRRLEPGGVFCQWLPLHQLDLATLRSIVRSFLTVHPRAWAMLASNSLETPVLGLVARADGGRFDQDAVRDRRSHLALPDRAASLGFEDELAILGSAVAGSAALERFAADAPANTDDHPVVAYRAPRITYAPDSSPRDRLIALLGALSIEPDELVVAIRDPAWPRRLSAYWAARNRFIASGRDVRPSARVEDMLAQVRDPLFSVLRISPDFRPAYDPLLTMATVLARSDASGARTLLTELERIQPARAEASQLLSLMGGGDNPTEGLRKSETPTGFRNSNPRQP